MSDNNIKKNIENNSAFNEELTEISIRGAKEHNLKNVDITLPRDKFIVITGLSGSGKSSLAFDTIYAEGQRRYIECMSVYARQFLGVLKKPEVDSIEGLSPAISIEQKSISRNPRSTVGTATEIYDYLRLLFAKVGVQYCTECNIPVEQKTKDQIIEEILTEFSKKSIMILAPLVRGRKGHYRDLFEQLLRQGYTKVRVDNKILDIENQMQLSRYSIHDIDLVIDRLKVEKKHEHRISEAIDLCLRKSVDKIQILYKNGIDKWIEKLYSTSYTCPKCGKAYEEPAPNKFSFNSPYGACKTCDGLGELTDFNIELIIPDRSKSISDGGIEALGPKRDTFLWSQVEAFTSKVGIDINTPISKIPKALLDDLLWGNEDNSDISVDYKLSNNRKVSYKYKFMGIMPMIRHQYNNTTSQSVRKRIESFMTAETCPVCHGGRLKIDNLYVRFAGKSINEITKMDINACYKFFQNANKSLNKNQKIIASQIIQEIKSRLKFLIEVGLTYISLDRSVKSLSGGESQRIRLASQIGSELVGITYVLDEPSIGLHQHDNNKLITSLKNLRDMGNTIIVVEHDKAMIEKSDYIVDLGPGAGVHGGNVTVSVKPSEIKSIDGNTRQKSLTIEYLLQKKNIEIPAKRRNTNGKFITLKGAVGNNLKNIDLKIPLGLLVCITGMSGSGKSSLINDTLYPILARHFYRSKLIPLKYSTIKGLDNIDKIIEINQSPIGRTPRSNPVTYTGIFTQIRNFFAMLPESKIRGYKTGRFSFNVKEGRCDACEGGGIKKIEMNFLPNVYVTCDVCKGKRYNSETLQVKYKGKSIADVLDLTVEESLEYFSEIPKIKKKLQTLYDVGLGYIKLGQQAPTLSGGEAQRVKLAAELSKINTGKTLYLLDEPTTGLHFEDINILLKLLNKLVEKGNTVVIIEHNLDVIKFADWTIDLGPKGGEEGGYIVAEGTPEDIAKNKKSITGKYLKKELI